MEQEPKDTSKYAQLNKEEITRKIEYVEMSLVSIQRQLEDVRMQFASQPELIRHYEIVQEDFVTELALLKTALEAKS